MGRNVTDITNKRFGSLVARREAGRTPAGAVRWECHCDCGGSHIATYQALVRKECTRCGACRTQKRRISAETDPLFHLHIKCHGSGHLGGLMVALDHEGNLKAFGGWSGIALTSSNPWGYRPMGLILANMVSKGLIADRQPGERFAAWEQRNRLRATIDRFVPGEVMRQWWDRADKAGMIGEYPPDYRHMWERTMVATIEGRLTSDIIP